MKSLPNITRLDTDKSHGWIVRVHYKGDFRRKLVSDKSHGGKRKSLEYAKGLLSQYKIELGKPETGRRVLGSNPHNTNEFRRGVRKIWKDAKEIFVVNWQSAPGKTSKKSFSVNKYT